MGYTRYWKRTKQSLTPEFLNDVNAILSDCKKKGITIRNGIGQDEPIVTLNSIALNGDGANQLDCETFYMSNDPDETVFALCKTERYPYDYAVRKILDAALTRGLVTDVRSDGPNEGIYSDNDYLTGNVRW